MTPPQDQPPSGPKKPSHDIVKFHQDCGHYGDDYEESQPDGAQVVEGDPYCHGC